MTTDDNDILPDYLSAVPEAAARDRQWKRMRRRIRAQSALRRLGASGERGQSLRSKVPEEPTRVASLK